MQETPKTNSANMSNNLLDETMVNPQVTSHQLAWLAGIWDGEGTFGMYKDNRGRINPRLTLSNTSPEMINEIIKIFDTTGIKGNLWTAKVGRKKNHKLETHITVYRLDSVLLGCELMHKFLVVKKARAELLMRFIKIRKGYKKKALRDHETGRILGIEKQGYSDDEISLFDQLKKLNQVGVLIDETSETTR